MLNETRQQMIDRLIGDRTRAEAERYKDKRMDASTPTKPETIFVASFSIGQVVRLKLDSEPNPGHVIGIDIRQYGVVYVVSWPHLRDSTPHCDFELEAVPDIDARAFA